MRFRKLEKLCVYWQRILRLQDWHINLQWSRRMNMASPARTGEVSWSSETKTAWISILDPQDRQKEREWEHDPEADLVHELLHLHLSRINPDAENVDEELAINCLAEALLTLKRGDKKVIA